MPWDCLSFANHVWDGDEMRYWMQILLCTMSMSMQVDEMPHCGDNEKLFGVGWWDMGGYNMRALWINW